MAQTATVQIQMPEMGESVTEGIVLEWHVAEGDFVNEGDTVVEVSTDKVDAEVPAPAAGVITKLIAQVDEEVPVGAPLAEMEPGEGFRRGSAAQPRVLSRGRGAFGASQAVLEPPPPRHPREETAEAADGRRQRRRRTSGRLRWRGGSPLSNGVDLGAVAGAGPGAKVTKEDVLAAADGGGNGGGCRAAAAGEAKPLRGPAAMLAQAMDESREVPTATSFRTISVDTLDAKRKALNGILNERGMKVSFTHLIAWAIVQAAKEWPVMTRVFERARRQAVRDRGRPGQPRHRRRRRAQGRLAQPDGAGDQGRRRASTSPPSTPTTRN